jgi:glycosyltransferase involved in cell wall biosynthesis
MRIGFFTDTYLPVRSGMEISIETFRIGLERLGHEVYVCAPTMRGYWDENPKVTRFRSMRVIKNPEMRLASPWSPVGRTLHEVTHIPLDIVHAHSPFTMGMLGKYVSHMQNIPLVYTNHTHNAEYAKVYFKEKLLLPYLAEKLVSWFSNESDTTIAPSSKFEMLLREYGSRVPIEILQTGIDVARFEKRAETERAAQELRKRYGIPENAPTLLYVGRMSEEKNVTFLVHALGALSRTHPDVRMFFIGNGASIEYYKHLAVQSGAQNAFFVGAVKPEEIVTYYHASQAFLFASLTDTQGIVILEAMASGLPVVALEDGALKDVMRNGENGFFVSPSASPETFASTVLQALAATPENAQISMHALETAAEHTLDTQAKKLAHLYERLISAHRHPKKAGA